MLEADVNRNAPELLAPAGDWECIRAAIENGADAVYFGLDVGFNARARAANFPLEDLPRLMATLHRRGLKGYTTLNTLVFTSELAQLEKVVVAVAEAGVDAVLVQDVGAALLMKQICPDLPLHASTQMTLTCAESVELAESLGIERVVLARELSIEEIVKIRSGTTMPLEVFVHGALCVAYSGQCLTSESLGGRSANRGQCAQACRLPYDLVCDGRDVDLGRQKYLLSPQDLAAYALAPELIAAGICSFKIEGRLKTPEYVANITRHYRLAIDSAMAGRPVEFTPRQVEEMELSFSRGFSHGWLGGIDHKELVPATSSSKRGVRLGTVIDVRRGRVIVQLAASIKRGDGVVFDSGQAIDHPHGGRVYEVFRDGHSVLDPLDSGRVELYFGQNSFPLDAIAAGDTVWKTDDPELMSRLRKTFTAADPIRRTPIDLVIKAAVGEPLRVLATTATGVACEITSEDRAVAATQHPLSQETLEKQFGRLGGTPFELRNLVANISGRPMLPFSVLGKLRHELVAMLESKSSEPPMRRIEWASTLRASRHFEKPPPTETEPILHIHCRSLAQMQSVLQLGETNLYAEFADIRQYREAVELARDHRAQIILVTPRIQKPGELGIFALLAKQQADGILVRNFGGLQYFAERGIPVIGDFSLNVTNELSAEFFMRQGLQRLTPSYDLNREQLVDLVAAVPPAWMEAVVHQHMPMFHMEHCVFCSVLSPGTDKTNCGRPCDEHRVQLRDRVGVEHPLTADVGCRNTLYNAVAQSAAEVIPNLLASGVRHFRIELLEEPAHEIRNIVESYRDLLQGKLTGKEVWTRLQAANRVGVTRGTLEERRNPLAIL